MDRREFFAELKRRSVYTVAVAYVVGGWALAEGISQVFPVFDIPNSVVRLIVLLIVLGFPVALVLSWFFDLTRYGIVRTPDRAPEAKIDIVGPSNLAEKSIAVLPFENLSEEKANAYFASGMGDEVLTKLAQLAELKVISRASTERYQSHPDDLRAVGRQLGVATVLAGSVQKAGDEVLISVQLIDVRNGNQLWAQGYRRTLKNIFEVEAEVAEKVAEALKVKLVRAEAQRLATPATNNQSPRARSLLACACSRNPFRRAKLGANDRVVAPSVDRGSVLCHGLGRFGMGLLVDRGCLSCAVGNFDPGTARRPHGGGER